MRKGKGSGRLGGSGGGGGPGGSAAGRGGGGGEPPASAPSSDGVGPQGEAELRRHETRYPAGWDHSVKFTNAARAALPPVLCLFAPHRACKRRA